MMQKHYILKKRTRNQLTFELILPFIVGAILNLMMNAYNEEKPPERKQYMEYLLLPFYLVAFSPYIFMY